MGRGHGLREHSPGWVGSSIEHVGVLSGNSISDAGASGTAIGSSVGYV